MKLINKLTEKKAQNYIIYNYGYLKHDVKKLVKASRETAKQYNCTPLEMFFFMIDDKPIKKLFTHSYNFNTRSGREIKRTFHQKYNSYPLILNKYYHLHIGPLKITIKTINK